MEQDLLFAWLSPIESNVDRKLHAHLSPARAKSPSPNSPLLRAKSAIRRTFSAGHRSQDHRERVREAQEACFWLRAAGFPQYVQMYEDGQFPISLSKFQVERDHAFLDQAAIDALIRRLNTLNRCADIMEEIRTKNDGTDGDMRALSEHWYFKKKARRWSRKHWPDEDCECSITPPAATPTYLAPPMLVSELRNSLSDLDRRIKTYSFLPGEDFSVLLGPGDSPPGSASDSGLSKTADLDLSDTASFSPSTSWGVLSDSTVMDGSIDNFATGILDTFDVSLKKLRGAKSQSLPDVFKACELTNDASTTDDSYVSTTSVSTTSAADSKEEHVLNDAYSVSTPTVNGHAEPPVLLLHTPPSSRGVRRVDSGASGGQERLTKSSEGEQVGGAVSPPQGVSRSGSAGEMATYPEVPLRNTTPARSNDGSLKKYRSAKWHSFQKLHSFQQGFKPLRTLIPIEELSSGQIGVLKKLFLVKLTALLELHKTKTNIARILRGRKQKQPDCKNKSMFGVPLSINVQRHGQALPPSILCAMEKLREIGIETKGVFRRPGSKAKVGSLRDLNETKGNTCYEGYSPYDIADLIKLYFRQLPEPLLTNKLSEILITVYENVPAEVRLQALQAVVLLIPDENREALRALLHFLSEVAAHSQTNQMDAQNLAVCLAPSLFYLPSSLTANKPSTLPLMRRGSFRRTTISHSPNLTSTKEVTNSVSSSQCLAEMIRHADRLFMVPADMLQVCKFSHLEFMDPVPCHELGWDTHNTTHNYVETSVTAVLKEARHSFKGWVYHDNVKGVEVSSLNVNDGIPLRLWRGVVKLPASPAMVLRKLWDHRYVWNGEVQKPRQVACLDYQTEVFQYVTPATPPLTDRDHCVLRSWRFDLALGCYVLVATSVSHPSADLQAGIRATELASRYLIEPLEGTSSILTYICRVDIRGCSADYYNYFGPYLASTVANIRDSINSPDHLETPV